MYFDPTNLTERQSAIADTVSAIISYDVEVLERMILEFENCPNDIRIQSISTLHGEDLLPTIKAAYEFMKAEAGV